MRITSIALITGLILLAGCAKQTPVYNQAPVTSGENAPSGSIHNLPIPAGVQAAKDALAARLKIDASTILVLEAHEKEWSDSCLGLGGPAESCLTVITPGYDVLMAYESNQYRYRTNEDGTAVRAE